MSKRFQVALIVLLALALIMVISLFSWYVFSSSPLDQADTDVENSAGLGAEEMDNLSVDTEKITTNLYNHDYIVIQFNILLNNEQAKEELEQRMSEVRAIIISTLSAKEPDDFQGDEGAKVEQLLLERFNDILHEGQVERVLTIDRQIQ